MEGEEKNLSNYLNPVLIQLKLSKLILKRDWEEERRIVFVVHFLTQLLLFKGLQNTACNASRFNFCTRVRFFTTTDMRKETWTRLCIKWESFQIQNRNYFFLFFSPIFNRLLDLLICEFCLSHTLCNNILFFVECMDVCVHVYSSIMFII